MTLGASWRSRCVQTSAVQIVDIIHRRPLQPEYHPLRLERALRCHINTIGSVLLLLLMLLLLLLLPLLLLLLMLLLLLLLYYCC